MARNSSGIYSLPSAPFVPGTVIQSAPVNSDFSDIASALTQSLATTGVSSMTAPLKLADGNAALPSLTLASDPTTGWYASSTFEWSFVSNGTTVITLNRTLVTFTANSIFNGTVTFTNAVTMSAALTVNLLSVLNATIASGGQSYVAPAPATGSLTLYSTTFNLGVLPFPVNPYIADGTGGVAPLYFRGGQCRLILNGGSLQLIQYMGNMLSINGVPREIPSGGVTLAASNTANVFVYIYAYMSAPTTMSLEMSTTVPVAQGSFGYQQKTGDTTRTLVGAAYTDTAGAWADTDGKLWVLSYFNRKTKSSRIAPGGTSITQATTTVTAELSTGFRNQFICWSDEIVRTQTNLSANTGVVAGPAYVFPRRDNLADSTFGVWVQASLSTNTTPIAINMNIKGVTENTVHYLTPTVLTSASNFIVITSAAAASPLAGGSFTVVETMG